jgi:hypothetical protein
MVNKENNFEKNINLCFELLKLSIKFLFITGPLGQNPPKWADLIPN